MNVSKAPIHQELKEIKQLTFASLIKELKTNALPVYTRLTVIRPMADIHFKISAKKRPSINLCKRHNINVGTK